MDKTGTDHFARHFRTRHNLKYQIAVSMPMPTVQLHPSSTKRKSRHPDRLEAVAHSPRHLERGSVTPWHTAEFLCKLPRCHCLSHSNCISSLKLILTPVFRRSKKKEVF